MSKINNYLTKNILNINEKNIWLNKYFKQIFLEGLKNDGISKNIINQIEMIFEENKRKMPFYKKMPFCNRLYYFIFSHC